MRNIEVDKENNFENYEYLVFLKYYDEQNNII
jgi:hypothetical protein